MAHSATPNSTSTNWRWPSSHAPAPTRCCATNSCHSTSWTATSSSPSGNPTPTPTPDRRAAENKAKRRLRFDVDLEFGLNSRTGRTLELTGSVVAEVYLGAPHRAPIIGRRALAKADPTPQLPLTGVSDDALARWVRGTVERIRTRGGIHHDLLRPYLEKNANRYQVRGGRPRGQGMPAFPKGRPAPAFPALKSGAGALPEGFDPITVSSSWYAQWASRCLDVSPADGTFLAKALFTELAAQMLLTTVTTETGSTVYGLAPATVQVSAATLEALLNGRHLLVCDICQTPVPGSATTVDELDGAPCTLTRCPADRTEPPRPTTSTAGSTSRRR